METVMYTHFHTSNVYRGQSDFDPPTRRRLCTKYAHVAALCGAYALLVTMMLSPVSAVAVDAFMFTSDTDWDYDTQNEIHIMRSNGKDHRRIVPRHTVVEATMSPDGKLLAYSTADTGEIRQIRTNGTNDRSLVSTGTAAEAMQWSPDGRYIAYSGREFVVSRSSFYLTVYLYDVSRRRIARKFFVQPTLPPGLGVNLISRIDWSADSRNIVIEESGSITFPLSFFSSTYIANVRTGKVVDKGDHFNYGFLNNREYVIQLSAGGLGLWDIKNDNIRELVNLGPNQEIIRLTRAADGKALMAQINGFRDSFNNGQTNLSRLEGKSRQDDLGYDYVYVRLRTKIATIVTPGADHFETSDGLRKSLEWRRMKSAAVFRQDTCWGWVITKKGTKRADRINGTRFNDVIYGFAGNDIIKGGGGNDVICGGAGHDRLFGQQGHDVFLGDADINREDFHTVRPGNDKIDGGDGVDTLYGNAGRDVLRGGSGNDFLGGGPGNDFLDGGPDENNLRGDEGNDRCKNHAQVESCER